jgi:peptidoglycan/LPS O-acetylase OafA/YrhL
MRLPTERIGDLLAYAGKYSYSIHLWHVPVRVYLPIVASRVMYVEMGPGWTDLFYVPLGIAVGIAMSLLVEYPILLLRDRVLPSNHSVPVNASGPELALVVLDAQIAS